MSQARESIPLSGGRLTPGVERIGDTVRRPTSESSSFVAALLQLLERRGFAGVPRFLGQDDAGRDVLSYVPGWVPAKFQQWTDAQVAAVGALTRRLHDATRGSDLAGRLPVVCHHDLGPNNVVFQDETPVAFIDFDLAAPGRALEDLGYLAWTWCVSSKVEARPVEVQARQVRVLADAYGLTDPERAVLVDAMLDRQARNAQFWAELRNHRRAVDASPDQIADRIAWSRREQAHTAAHRSVFNSALC